MDIGDQPGWQLGQVGGQQAAAAVPSLLQMAEGDGTGLAAGWLSDPELNNGVAYRAITSPEDQNWSDLQGNPIHMGEAAPAYNPGTTQGGYNAVFDPRAPSSTGGYFTMKDYLKDNPQQADQWGNNFLSTNNWRLLGDDPDQFMINGQVVNRRALRDELAPKSVLGTEGTGPKGIYFAGGGKFHRPIGSYGSALGYIGSDNWPIEATPTY